MFDRDKDGLINYIELGYVLKSQGFNPTNQELIEMISDVEENEELAVEFGIRNIPTILFFKNGQVVDKLVGAQPKAKIEEKFQSLL